MSGAAGFSPDESWYVVLFAATLGAAGAESAPEATVGSATTATAIARRSPGRVSGRTTRVRVDAARALRNCLVEDDHAADAVLRLHQLEAAVDLVERRAGG